MIRVDDLVQLAEELQSRGCEACHEILAGPDGAYHEGLDIGLDFFTWWELSLPENQDDLERLDFAAIKSRRRPSWPAAPADATAV